MVKLAAGLLSVIFFAHACSEKKEPNKSTIKFTSFEICYTNVWTRGISFRVDSNKIFLASQRSDSVKYGLLPDSILRLIDATLSRIISDTTIKSKDDGCVDCSIVTLQALIGNDTISIHQVGDIDKVFWPLVKTVRYFLDSVHHSIIHAALFLETQKMAFPPLLPLPSNDRQFFPPKTTTKSSR